MKDVDKSRVQNKIKQILLDVGKIYHIPIQIIVDEEERVINDMKTIEMPE